MSAGTGGRCSKYIGTLRTDLRGEKSLCKTLISKAGRSLQYASRGWY
jgi:hypothetical protein